MAASPSLEVSAVTRSCQAQMAMLGAGAAMQARIPVREH
jgi:hypothetical protein